MSKTKGNASSVVNYKNGVGPIGEPTTNNTKTKPKEGKMKKYVIFSGITRVNKVFTDYYLASLWGKKNYKGSQEESNWSIHRLYKNGKIGGVNKLKKL